MEAIQFNTKIYQVRESVGKEKNSSSVNRKFQDVAMDSLAYRDRFHKGAEIRSWLYELFNPGKKPDVTKSTVSPSSEMQEKLSKLDSQSRACFEQYYSGTPLEQIALKEGVHINTLKNRIAFSKAALRRNDVIKY